MTSCELIPINSKQAKKSSAPRETNLREDALWQRAVKQMTIAANKQWRSLKKQTKAMDFYSFVVWWYELEIIRAWYWYAICNDYMKGQMERRCRHCIHGKESIIATELKLKLEAINNSPSYSTKDFLKLMCMLKNEAFGYGIFLAQKTGEPMFSTFNLQCIHHVRRELVHRFTENRANAAIKL